MTTTSKPRTATLILGRSPSLFLHIDARTEGLQVPQHLIGRAHIILQVGHEMPVPIPDLEINALGVIGTLSFRGKPFRCVIPWDSVKCMCGEDGKGAIFDRAWFQEMNGAIAAAGLTGSPEAPRHPSERPYLRRVK